MHPSRVHRPGECSCASRMHLRMQPLARFPPCQPLFLHAIAPFPSPFALLLPPSPSLFLSHSPSIFTFSSESRHLSPSYSLLRFFTLPQRRSVHGVPLFSPHLPCAFIGAPFFSHTHPRPNNPSRLVPFRTFTFAQNPTLRIIPSMRYTIYIHM